MQKTINSNIELMAPAGSWESLQAGIKAGADSIYFGVEQLNMRARAAKSFKTSDISKIVSRCHAVNVKSYLAVNTIIYDEELDQAKHLIKQAKSAKIDAIIATDIAVIQLAKELGVNVHISTQANISNIQSVAYFSQFSDVMVLARELNLDQIHHIAQLIQQKEIRGPSGQLVRLEVFIHGALCVAIAGKCGMSLATSNHSANRGDCFQPCRRKYKVTDLETGTELSIDNQYVMSPKDLCTIGMLDLLIKSGISILKIEGRGRTPDYVFHVTQVYKEAVQSIAEGTYSQEKITEWQKRLNQVYNRGFWQNGYYLGHPLGEWTGTQGSQARRKRHFIGYAKNYFAKSKIAEFDIKNDHIAIGDTIIVTGPTTGFVEHVVESIFVNKKPVQRTYKKDRATIPFPEKVRPSDKIFVIKDRFEI